VLNSSPHKVAPHASRFHADLLRQPRSHSANPESLDSPQRAALFRAEGDGSEVRRHSGLANVITSPSSSSASASSTSLVSVSGSGVVVQVQEQQGEMEPMEVPRKRSISRVESLPNLSQLKLRENDWSSVVVPQPRKPMAAPSAVRRVPVHPHSHVHHQSPHPHPHIHHPSPHEDHHHEEALNELLDIFRSSSSQFGWTGSESPRSHRSPYEGGGDQDDAMEIPALSVSPRPAGTHPKDQDMEDSNMEVVFGESWTPLAPFSRRSLFNSFFFFIFFFSKFPEPHLHVSRTLWL